MTSASKTHTTGRLHEQSTGFLCLWLLVIQREVEGENPLGQVPAQKEELSDHGMFRRRRCVLSLPSMELWGPRSLELHWLLEGRSEGCGSNVSTKTKIIIKMSLCRKLTSSYTAWSGVTEESGIGNCCVEDDTDKCPSSIRPHLGLKRYVNLQKKA